jgi:hypothetical protein
MTDGINTAMNAVQAAGGDSVPHRARGQPEPVQLLRRNHAVLSRGEAGDRRIPAALGAFFPDNGNKAPTPAILPREAGRPDSKGPRGPLKGPRPWAP